LLAELLTGQRTPAGRQLRSVKLHDAKITGPLDSGPRRCRRS
jgi:hypothetical protein